MESLEPKHIRLENPLLIVDHIEKKDFSSSILSLWKVVVTSTILVREASEGGLCVPEGEETRCSHGKQKRESSPDFVSFPPRIMSQLQDVQGWDNGAKRIHSAIALSK